MHKEEKARANNETDIVPRQNEDILHVVKVFICPQYLVQYDTYRYRGNNLVVHGPGTHSAQL